MFSYVTILRYTVFCVAAASCLVTADDSLIPVDDSYTVSKRYLKYKQLAPSITLPSMTFVDGQEILFERRYHTIGSRELHMDVFLPTANIQKNSAILLIHGGGWRSGSKSHFYPLANMLAKRGYVVAIPEYRLSTEARYPAGLNDINHAIIWLKKKSKEYGFKSQQLMLCGASSGGQMAALIANTANKALYKKGVEETNTKVAAVVVMDGVLDFESPIAFKFETKKGAKAAAALWFGGSYESIPKTWSQASPVNHINKQSPSMLVIGSGQPRFTDGKEAVFKKLQSFDIPHEYYGFDNVIHTFWLFEPYLTSVANKIDDFHNKIFPN